MPSPQGLCRPHSLWLGQQRAAGMSQQRHLCPFVLLISFLRSWEASLCWDWFQTKVNLFLSNKAVRVCLPAAAGWARASAPPGPALQGCPVPRGNPRSLAVRGSPRQVGHQPGWLQPQPPARLWPAQCLEAGQRGQGNSPRQSSPSRVTGPVLARLGVTPLPMAALWPSSCRRSLRGCFGYEVTRLPAVPRAARAAALAALYIAMGERPRQREATALTHGRGSFDSGPSIFLPARGAAGRASCPEEAGRPQRAAPSAGAAKGAVRLQQAGTSPPLLPVPPLALTWAGSSAPLGPCPLSGVLPGCSPFLWAFGFSHASCPAAPAVPGERLPPTCCRGRWEGEAAVQGGAASC